MKKRLQGIFSILKISLGILVFLGVTLWLLKDLKIFKSSVAEFIHDQTGIPVDIFGDLQLTFFPTLGVQLRQFSVKNAHSYSEQPIADLGKVALGLKLLPLFSGRIDLDTLRLNGLRVYLIRNKQGQFNWQGLVSSSDTSDTKSKAQIIRDILGSFEGDGVQLKQGYLRYEDHLTLQTLELKEVNVHIARLQLGQAIPVKLDFTLNHSRTALTQKIQIYFDITLNAIQDLAQIQHFKLLSDTPFNPHLTTQLTIADVHYRLDTQSLGMYGLHLQNASLNVYSELQGQAQPGNYEMQASLKLPDFNLKEWLKEWAIKLPNMQDKAALTHFSADAKMTLTQDSVKMSPLTVMLDQTAFKGFLTLNHFDQPLLNFDFVADKVALERYMEPKSINEPKNVALIPESFTTQLEALSIALTFLKSSHSTGQIKIHQITLKELSLQDFVLGLHE